MIMKMNMTQNRISSMKIIKKISMILLMLIMIIRLSSRINKRLKKKMMMMRWSVSLMIRI